jgi:hypothetical protein
MEQCANIGCTNPAEVEKVIDAPFSMTSTASNSKRTMKVCLFCAEQMERNEEFTLI